jgi:UDP-N-acetylglucosamine 2-epimerase (non-hydrolysing)
MTIDLVAGTRPNFMKIAPIWRVLEARRLPRRLIHTGQHFDPSMSDVFFRDLGLPEPDIRLTGGGGTHAEQTASVLTGIERTLLHARPSVLVVVGDVTSTLAAALAAAKLGVPVAHVEAGLRSGDWTMPEEINRVVTDRLSDLLLTTSREANDNLAREGIPSTRIRFVGNVMIDSLHWALRTPTDALLRFGLERQRYALVTLHRPANVDSRGSLEGTLAVLRTIAARMRVLFPMHPRTTARVDALGLTNEFRNVAGLTTCEPLGYNDFVTLMANAAVVASDSGGVQEETTALGVPCLTLRNGTERPITVELGTNVVVGLDCKRIDAEIETIASGQAKRGRVPDGWDGNAAVRVVDAIERLMAGDPPPLTVGPRA